MLIPRTKPDIILTSAVPTEVDYQGLRIVRCQSDAKANEAYAALRYEFLHQPAEYTPLKATLCRKGAVGVGPNGKGRLVAIVHPTIRLFTHIVKYDPSNPSAEVYDAHQMREAHEKTQSDFKGQKSANRERFKHYILEGIEGNRALYLPVVSGWQSVKVFPKTVFVAFDEEDPNALYGMLYLPKSPVMQADGQTQTAALFAVAGAKDAIERGALDGVTVTLEVELKVDEAKAGQSFADRNGRGSKKNGNLVIALDISSPLSELRTRATAGTVFEGRIANGRSPGTSVTATTNVVDLSTMEQILLNALTGGRCKPEELKHFHVPVFLPYARELVEMLDKQFAAQWPEKTPPKEDTFRQLYAHGWPFALKAIALAYHEARIDKLGPLAAAVRARDAGMTLKDAFEAKVKTETDKWDKQPAVTIDELRDRLARIDWRRYRKHWIDLTGAKMGKDGKRRTFKLKSSGEEKVLGQAQNTATVIGAVKSKILSASWTDLTTAVDAPVQVK